MKVNYDRLLKIVGQNENLWQNLVSQIESCIGSKWSNDKIEMCFNIFLWHFHGQQNV